MPLNAPLPYAATNLQDLIKVTTDQLKLKCSKRGGDLIVKIIDEKRIELTGQVAPVLQGTMQIK